MGRKQRAVRGSPATPTPGVHAWVGVVGGARGGGQRRRRVRRPGRRLPGPHRRAERRRHLGDQQPGRLLRPHQQADRRARRHHLLPHRLQPRHRPGRLVGRRDRPFRGDRGASRPLADAGADGEEAAIPGSPPSGWPAAAWRCSTPPPAGCGPPARTPPSASDGDEPGRPDRAASPRSATMPRWRSRSTARVYAVSAAEDQLVTLAQRATRASPKPTTDELPGDAVQRRRRRHRRRRVPVVLDSASGRLSVIGGAEARGAKGSVLQQPGPARRRSWSARREALLSVDLATGEVTDGRHGCRRRPGQPGSPRRLPLRRLGRRHGCRGDGVRRGEPRAPGRSNAQTSDLVFRTNRGQIVLNDRASGNVWDIDSDKPTRLDNWDAFRLKAKDENDDRRRPAPGPGRPAPAEGQEGRPRGPARAARRSCTRSTTTPHRRAGCSRSARCETSAVPMHSSPSAPMARPCRSPCPTTPAGGASFEYFIDDGRQSVSAHATVRVGITGPGRPNSEPELREGFEPRVWVVPASGSIDVPVLPDWRDPQDGDPVSTVAARAVTGPSAGADARVTSAGAVRFHAPGQGGLVRSSTTSPTAWASRHRESRLPGPGAHRPRRRRAGRRARRDRRRDRPADRHLPAGQRPARGRPRDPGRGAQPRRQGRPGAGRRRDHQPRQGHDHAALARPPRPTSWSTRRRTAPPTPPPARSGWTSEHPRTRPWTRWPSPTASPCSARPPPWSTCWPTTSTRPAGCCPSSAPTRSPTTSSTWPWSAAAGCGYQRPSGPAVAQPPDHPLHDQQRPALRDPGQVVVSQRPPPADNTPVTQNDEVTVRAGTSQAIPVLDNDFSPSGGSLTLISEPASDDRAGRLDVQPVGAPAATPVRRSCPAARCATWRPRGSNGPQRFTIRYQVANDEGETADGKARVTVLPLRPKNNNPPEPPVVEGRTVSGDTVKLRVPGYGVDPDGDAVTILGLDSAPELGRVVRIGANSIEYTAYPSSVGTDEFTYSVTDSLGAVRPAPCGSPSRRPGRRSRRSPSPTRSPSAGPHRRGRRLGQRPGRHRQPRHRQPGRPARGRAAPLGDRADRDRRSRPGRRSEHRGGLPHHRRPRQQPDHDDAAHPGRLQQPAGRLRRLRRGRRRRLGDGRRPDRRAARRPAPPAAPTTPTGRSRTSGSPRSTPRRASPRGSRGARSPSSAPSSRWSCRSASRTPMEAPPPALSTCRRPTPACRSSTPTP